ncbi:hypothetical protein [Avibacterium avium]|uniref:hypothetical protein n=1 Tax=Avibacterium avium TaxID=751 RepID=UPI003BF8D95A
MKNKELFLSIIRNGFNNINEYSFFVSFTEDAFSQNEELETFWIDMEIINALALDDWEKDGYPKHWQKWEKKYLPEINKLINELKELLDSIRED